MMMIFKHINKFFVISVVLFSFVASAAFAMSIGRDGPSFEENGIMWQPVKYEDGKSGFKAAFPGEPTSGISSPWNYIFSAYGTSHYEIHFHMQDRVKTPKNEKTFLKHIEESMSETDVLTPLDISSKFVIYAAEVTSYDSSKNLVKMYRVYLGKDNVLYFAIIEGQDFSLAAEFFNKINFGAK